MKKSNINHANVFTIVFIISFLLISSQSKSGNFIWNGSIDSQWAKANNWSPSGIPSGQDTIQIVSSTNNNNLVLDSNRTVTRFIMQSDTMDLGGFTLIATGSSSFISGYITNGTLDLRGSSSIFSGTKINATTSAVCSKATFQNTVFLQPVVIDITSAVADTSLGNNVFQNTLSLRNSAGASVIFGYSNRDSILGDFTVYDTLSHTILLGYNDTSYFGGHIYVGSTGSGISFGGNTTGFAKLASGKTITVSSKGFSAGTLLLNNFIQTGNTSQSLTLTGSSILSLISSSFEGAVTFTSPNMLVKGSTFNGKSIFSRSSSVSNSWEGGNTFVGAFRFTNTGSGNIFMQTSNGDIFEDSVTINAGTARFYPSTVEESVYKNNLYFTGSYVDFSQGTGATKFSGSINQLINGSSNLSFKNMTIDKSGGILTLQAPITITNTLDFINGNLITDTTHLLTFTSGSSWLNGGNNSFVSGPVKKTGNASPFTFPTGKGNAYNPIAITGSLNTTDAFLAEYFNTGQTAGDSLSDSIKYVYDCNYWKLKQTTGTTNVYVTLAWDTACVLDTGLLRVTKWDGAKWADLGRGTITGNTSGTIKSATASLQNYYVALANPILIVAPLLNTNTLRNVENFYGISGANTFRNTDHDWRFSNDADDELKNNVHGLYPGLLKFNAAAQGNYLNWRKGWFFDDEHYKNYNQLLPDNYFSSSFYDENYINYDIRLEQFKNALTFSGATPIFQVNITSSDIDFQVGLLLEAKRMNINVKYIELGGEVNIDKLDGNNARAFASGLEYAQTAYKWTRRIKVALGEDVLVGVVASNNQDDYRRKYWNEKMIAEFNKLETPATLGPDAMIIHQYLHDIVPGGQLHQRWPITDFDRMFCTPFLELKDSYHNKNGDNYCLDDNELAEIEILAPNRYKVWLTEYGMDDAYWMVHGSWGGGLFNALQSLLYLENDKITMAVNFTLWSNCVFGDIFVDDNAFRFDGDPDETGHQFIFNGMPANYKNTVTDQYSAQGHAMKHIGKALKNAVSGQQLTFPNHKSTQLETFFDTDANHTPFTIYGLYGWHFSDNATTPKDQMVILNLTGKPVQIGLSQIGTSGYWTNYDITYTSPDLFPLGDNESCMDWAGNTGSTSIDPEDPPPFSYPPLFDYTALSVSASGMVFMPAYSIVRIYNCAMPELTVTASAENMCSGQDVTLTLTTPMEDGWNIDSWNVNINGSGATSLNHDITPYTTDDFSMPYTFNNCTPEIREYTVTVTNSGCATATTVTSNPVSVYIYPPVDVEVTTSQVNPCPGSQIQLTAAPGSSTANCYNGVNYVWITGDGDGIGTTNPLTVNADKLTNYIAYANFNFTNQITSTAFNCAAFGELELGPDPPPAGLPDDTVVCYGDQFNINLSQYATSHITWTR